MKLQLYLIFLFLLAGCASSSFNRVENEYILNVEEHKISLIQVSSDFQYMNKETINGLPMDVFSDKSNKRQVLVLNKFGWYDQKAIPTVPDNNDQKMVGTLSDTQITILLRTNDDQDVISRGTFFSELDVNDKWINMYVGYIEILPQKYQFESWEYVPDSERKEFLDSFYERADRSVQFMEDM